MSLIQSLNRGDGFTAILKFVASNYIVVALCLGVCLKCSALEPERYYQEQWVAEHPGSEAEVVMPDGTRCDIITEEFAIEVDWAEKWAEAIGQSLYYAAQTGKRPGILLILKDPKDQRFLQRLQTVIHEFQLGITIDTIEAWAGY